MKILTALNDINLNKKIKNKLNKDIVLKDLMYKEAILEYLKMDKDISILILNENIPGDLNIFELIKEILEINKFIEIITILEEDDTDLRKFLATYNINKILIKDKYSFDDVLRLITNDSNIKQKSIEKEIDELRKLVFKQEENTFKYKFKNNISNIRDEINKRKEIKRIRKLEKGKNKIENKNRKDKKIKKKDISKNNKEDNKIYISLSEEIQKYNIDSIDITIRVKELGKGKDIICKE